MSDDVVAAKKAGVGNLAPDETMGKGKDVPRSVSPQANKLMMGLVIIGDSMVRVIAGASAHTHM